MTTSRQPWTTQALTDCKASVIHDANGKRIGVFEDWQDAELVIKCIENPGAWEHWKGEYDFQVEENELAYKEIEKLNDQVARLEDENQSLRAQVDELQAELDNRNP